MSSSRPAKRMAYITLPSTLTHFLFFFASDQLRHPSLSADIQLMSRQVADRNSSTLPGLILGPRVTPIIPVMRWI